MNRLGVLFILCVTLFLAGCGQQLRPPEETKLCPCRKDFTFPESGRAVSFYIRADGLIEIPAEGLSESYNVKIFYEPPSKLYIQGDHPLKAKAIIAGGSADQFWFWVRHNEVDSFWFGPWDNGCLDSSLELAMNPSMVLEAMGLVYCFKDYPLMEISSNYYIFSKTFDDGTVKRLLFDCCNEKLSRIETIAANGLPLSITDIDNYFQTANNFELPGRLSTTIFEDGQVAGSAVIDLQSKSFKLREYNEKFAERFFSLPMPKGVEHIYNMMPNGNFIEID